MEKVQIQAEAFFELLKMKDTSMWEIFAQMIDGKEREITFVNEEKKMLFAYILPENLEKLQQDREKFATQYAEKLSGLN
ncbi:MAG: hypothetical protein ACOH1X_04745 [Kaistella sp.]